MGRLHYQCIHCRTAIPPFRPQTNQRVNINVQLGTKNKIIPEYYTHMNLEGIENVINQNHFWDMWNNFNSKQPQALPIQNGEIWRAHFENLNKDIPIN